MAYDFPILLHTRNWKLDAYFVRLTHFYLLISDLESNDSYNTLTLDESTPPHGGSRFMHGGSGSSPTYLSSPTHPLPYGSTSDSYSSLGHYFYFVILSLYNWFFILFSIYFAGVNHTAPSDISDGSSNQYVDFPPSPDSWLDDTTTPHPRY